MFVFITLTCYLFLFSSSIHQDILFQITPANPSITVTKKYWTKYKSLMQSSCIEKSLISPQQVLALATILSYMSNEWVCPRVTLPHIRIHPWFDLDIHISHMYSSIIIDINYFSIVLFYIYDKYFSMNAVVSIYVFFVILSKLTPYQESTYGLSQLREE